MSAARDPSDLDWALAGRYLAGELSTREHAAFERWIAEDPARREEMALARQLWDDAGAIPDGARVDAMWRSVAGRMRTAHRDDRRAPLHVPRAEARQRFAIVSSRAAGRRVVAAYCAAAAVLLATFGLTERWLRSGVERARAPVPREFRTGPGQRATVQLGDGTRVELGVASVLTVAPFGDGAREVTLRGEAVFDVVHDGRRPFRVHSAGTVIEDLGTRFSVRAYDADRDVRVVVTSGVVALHTPHAPQARPSVVRAGQLARLDSLGHVTLDASADTARYLAWTDGRVLIHNQTLRDAAVEIERWHDVRISIPDATVAGLRVTVDMHLGSLQKTLDAVTAPLGLRYVVADGTARIRR